MRRAQAAGSWPKRVLRPKEASERHRVMQDTISSLNTSAPIHIPHPASALNVHVCTMCYCTM